MGEGSQPEGGGTDSKGGRGWLMVFFGLCRVKKRGNTTSWVPRAGTPCIFPDPSELVEAAEHLGNPPVFRRRPSPRKPFMLSNIQEYIVLRRALNSLICQGQIALAVWILSNIKIALDDDNDRRGVKHKSKEESEMRTGRIK